MSTKDYISYEEVIKDCKKLAEALKNCEINKIIAITRGGMVPACLIAELLNIRQIGSVALASYDEGNRSELKLLSAPNLPIDEKTLFIDDLYDSGNTYRYLKHNYPQAKCAVVYTKEPTADIDFPAISKDKNLWLVFPWEFE